MIAEAIPFQRSFFACDRYGLFSKGEAEILKNVEPLFQEKDAVFKEIIQTIPYCGGDETAVVQRFLSWIPLALPLEVVLGSGVFLE